jgi:type III secretion protein L
VKKKFFSLIKNQPIHIAPKTKVVPQEDIDLLLDGKELLEEIQKDAEQYRKEASLECEKLKEQAQIDGYEEGFKSWAEHIAKLEEEIIKVRKEFEKVLIPIALKAAKKIVGREIELSEDVIVDIVSNALKPVVTHKKITVYVNRKDLDVLEKNKPRLKQLFETLEAFSLRERADVKEGCIIETEGGIINAQLDNQWRILEKAFDNLVKGKQGK